MLTNKEKKEEIARLDYMLHRNKDNNEKHIIQLKVHWMELKEKLERAWVN